jgi:hypothetical protein
MIVLVAPKKPWTFFTRQELQKVGLYIYIYILVVIDLNYPPPAWTRRLTKYDSEGRPHELQTTIEFTIVSGAASTSATDNQMDEAIMQGNNAMEQMKRVLPPLVVSGDTVGKAMIDRTAPIADTWEPLLAKIEVFTKIVDQISEVRHATEHRLILNAMLCCT